MVRWVSQDAARKAQRYSCGHALILVSCLQETQKKARRDEGTERAQVTISVAHCTAPFLVEFASGPQS